MHVEAIGAAGATATNTDTWGTSQAGAAGGRGAEVVGDVSLPGQTSDLYVLVGGTDGYNGGGSPGAYGYDPTQTSYTPATGGGASDVRTIDAGQTGSLDSRLLVAAGGGGGGGGIASGGAAGGDAGSSGGSTQDNFGGGAGTQTAGGAGGTSTPFTGYNVSANNGTDGSLGQGGDRGSGYYFGCFGLCLANSGGGGGGGYYGGGGGGAAWRSTSTGAANSEGGGGGGGGSNLVPADGSASVTSSPAQVVVTFERPAVATPEPTTTAVSVNNSTSQWDDPATATATVTAAGGEPVYGQVQLYDASSPVGNPVTLTAGQASLSLQGLLSAGEHQLSADYLGDSTTGPSTSSTVNETYSVTQTFLSAFPSGGSYNSNTGTTTFTYGSPIEIQASFDPVGEQQLQNYLMSNPGAQPGTLQLYDGTQPVGSAQPLTWISLMMRSLDFVVPSPSAGVHQYHVIFSGNAAFSSADSGQYNQFDPVVTGVPTTVTVTSSLSADTTLGQAPALAATVTRADGITATGTVQFTDNGQPLGAPVPVGLDGTADLAPGALPLGTNQLAERVAWAEGQNQLGTAQLGTDGDASLTLPGGLPVGGHVISAAYGGDIDHAASSTDPTAVVIHSTGTTVTLAPGTLDANDGLTLTASLTPSTDGLVPTGTVSFYDGQTLLGAGAVSGGSHLSAATATLHISLDPGVHAFEAVYGGDQQFHGAGSSAHGLKIDSAPTPTPTPRSGRIQIVSERRPLDGGSMRVRLYCQGAAARWCVGTVRVKRGPAAMYSVPAAKLEWLAVKIPAKLRAYLASHGSTYAMVIAVPRKLAGDERTPAPAHKWVIVTPALRDRTGRRLAA